MAEETRERHREFTQPDDRAGLEAALTVERPALPYPAHEVLGTMSGDDWDEFRRLMDQARVEREQAERAAQS